MEFRGTTLYLDAADQPDKLARADFADAVAGRGELLLDGGIRRGTDILKALALGARAVLIGRPVYWGLAVGGASGVRHILDLLRAELALDLMLCALASPEEVGRELLVPADAAIDL